eukprot:9497866-Pyramimonas_sp.AAC.1
MAGMTMGMHAVDCRHDGDCDLGDSGDGGDDGDDDAPGGQRVLLDVRRTGTSNGGANDHGEPLVRHAHWVTGAPDNQKHAKNIPRTPSDGSKRGPKATPNIGGIGSTPRAVGGAGGSPGVISVVSAFLCRAAKD